MTNKNLLNDLFYTPDINKSEMEIDAIASILELPKNLLTSLQYNDRETIKFIKPRVFIYPDKNAMVKVRVCHTNDEAEGVYRRALFAYKQGLPVAQPVKTVKNLALFVYIDGTQANFENAYQVKEISKIHSQLNNISISAKDNLACISKTKHLIDYCIKEVTTLIGEKLAHKAQNTLHSKSFLFLPVFDHQDFGKHNVICASNTSKYFIMDEEAFGIIPFGYSIVKAIYERENYRLISPEYLDLYLESFPNGLSDYYRTNENRLRLLFILRTYVRHQKVGNFLDAKKLLSMIDELVL